jgi:hypothetical protein
VQAGSFSVVVGGTIARALAMEAPDANQIVTLQKTVDPRDGNTGLSTALHLIYAVGLQDENKSGGKKIGAVLAMRN